LGLPLLWSGFTPPSSETLMQNEPFEAVIHLRSLLLIPFTLSPANSLLWGFSPLMSVSQRTFHPVGTPLRCQPQFALFPPDERLRHTRPLYRLPAWSFPFLLPQPCFFFCALLFNHAPRHSRKPTILRSSELFFSGFPDDFTLEHTMPLYCPVFLRTRTGLLRFLSTPGSLASAWLVASCSWGKTPHLF